MEAILVAAGSSRRMGFDKLSASLCGRSVLENSLRAFAATSEVSRILLVCADPEAAHVIEAVSGIDKPCRVLCGGKERADSVRNGLAAVSGNCAYVAIHDAARPLIRPEQIRDAFLLAQESGACTLAEPCADTLHRAAEDGLLRSTLDRKNVWRIQTPQIFQRDLLLESLRLAEQKGVALTDEASAVIAAGHGVAVLPSATPNFKITLPQDIELARAILERHLQSSQQAQQ